MVEPQDFGSHTFYFLDLMMMIDAAPAALRPYLARVDIETLGAVYE
jgi:hypothetical protein